MRPRHPDAWLAVGAILVPAATALALIPLRDVLVSTNVALLLVITVVAFAASGRRAAAVLAAGSAALGFNLFHTQPYLSLRIDSHDDIETAALLLAVGLAVGELAVRGRRARALVVREREDLASIQGLGAMVASGEASDYVLLATASELTHLLHLVDCRFETEPVDGHVAPVVHRDGTIRWGPTDWDASRWGFPSDGVTIPVFAHGRRRGRFVLTAPIGLPVAREQLAKAVALVDQAGASLAASAGAA